MHFAAPQHKTVCMSVAQPKSPGQSEFVLLISSVMMLVAFAIDSMLPALPAIGASLRVADAADQPLVIGAFLFGFSIALDGDTLAVGALFEASNATGVNGNQGNNSAPDSGATYVFSLQ